MLFVLHASKLSLKDVELSWKQKCYKQKTFNLFGIIQRNIYNSMDERVVINQKLTQILYKVNRAFVL